ncbi:MAG: single-stranded DNA-binding protein, partial [Phormidesmis sp. CAN_BIN44]|nr:single-stranded DNA-binding protein [Phormidesmis sp. CAN_BIN44]
MVNRSDINFSNPSPNAESSLYLASASQSQPDLPSADAAESPVVMTMQNTDDLDKLLGILPDAIRVHLENHPQLDSLIEVVMDLGRRPEARFPGKAEYLSEIPITQADLNDSIT